jgi:hypothetical protein
MNIFLHCGHKTLLYQFLLAYFQENSDEIILFFLKIVIIIIKFFLRELSLVNEPIKYRTYHTILCGSSGFVSVTFHSNRVGL